MKKTMTTLGMLVLATSLCPAALVRLDNTGPSLGANLDETQSTDTPVTLAVPEISGLTITVYAIGPDGDINSTSNSLGVNSVDTATDHIERFDSDLNEIVTFSFSQAVSITQLDFVSFETDEVFNFAGVVINYDDLSNKTTDVYDFTSPLEISSNTQFSIQATAGSIGIEAMTFTAVPEPSSSALLGFGGLALILRRRK